MKPVATFEHVRDWVFDLDNTLYPAQINLFTQVDQRITAWIANFHGIDGLSARQLQKYYYLRHGTSLNGLMTVDGIDPAPYLAFVHDIDHSAIEPDPALSAALGALTGRRFILTNGSRRHAERIAGRLGILHHFDGISDIADADFTPKPRAEAYHRFLHRHSIDPASAAMFEDLAHNLEVPHALGMRTILVVPSGPAPPTAHSDWNIVKEDDQRFIDHTTDHLAGFLAALPDVSSDIVPA